MNKAIGTGFSHSMNIRKKRLMLEWIYIAGTSVIVILAVCAFFFQATALVLFPIIFVLAAAMNYLTGIRYLERDSNNRRHIPAAVLFLTVATGLLVIAIIGIIMLVA